MLLALSLSIYSPAIAAFACISTYVYIKDRRDWDKEDELNNKKRVDFVKRYNFYLKFLENLLITIVIVLVLIHILGNVSLFSIFHFFLSFILIFSLLYYSKVKPFFVANSLYVSSALSLQAIYFVFLFSQRQILIIDVIVIVLIFIIIDFSFVELDNIPDVEGDKKNNISTIPTEFGIQNTFVIIFSLLFTSLIISYYFFNIFIFLCILIYILISLFLNIIRTPENYLHFCSVTGWVK